MSQVLSVRTLSTDQQVCITALAIFVWFFFKYLLESTGPFFAPPTTDVFMYFQFITVFASWDVV